MSANKTVPPPGGEGAGTPRPPVDQAAELLDVERAAALLSCSPRHLMRLTDARQGPPSVRLGRLVRYPRRLLLRWIEETANVAGRR